MYALLDTYRPELADPDDVDPMDQDQLEDDFEEPEPVSLHEFDQQQEVQHRRTNKQHLHTFCGLTSEAKPRGVPGQSAQCLNLHVVVAMGRHQLNLGSEYISVPWRKLYLGLGYHLLNPTQLRIAADFLKNASNQDGQDWPKMYKPVEGGTIHRIQVE
ncbi:hypothetical protein BDZ91DRAFT_760787 [Kalaharituber pfeilii]|nr:hypothetical protein BDZ91DRAFT_760787 [Kalaharituber pfeilii]